MEREMTELSVYLRCVCLLVRKKYTLVAVLGQKNREIKGIFLLKTEKGGKKVVLLISVLPVSKFFSLVWGLPSHVFLMYT